MKTNTRRVTSGRLELQELIHDTLTEEYPRVQKRLAFLFPQKIIMPNMFLTIQDINSNIKVMLEPALMTMIHNNLLGLDLTEDIKSDYYDGLIGSQIGTITYTLFCTLSDFILSSLLYYVSKEYMFEYVKNTIVRPNIKEALTNVRQTLMLKDKISQEMEDAKEYRSLVETTIHDLMIKLDGEKFLDSLVKVIEYKLDDRETITDNAVNESRIFVPDFLQNIMVSGAIDEFNHAKISKFLSEYIVTFSKESIINLFKAYSNFNDRLVELVDTTITERNVYQGVAGLTLVDGLKISENIVLNKIINLQQLSDNDNNVIGNNKILNNVKSVIDKFRKYDDTVRIDKGDVIITKKDGSSKHFNVIKFDVAKDLSDPFNVFTKSKWVKKKFMTDRVNSCLYQTGMSKAEEQERLLSGKGFSFSQTPEDRVFDRQRKIQRLLLKLQNNKDVTEEYDRITKNRIDSIKYLNESQSKPYVIEDESRLLLVLAETEAVYKQIMLEIANKKE